MPVHSFARPQRAATARQPAALRLYGLDAVRGIAMLWMTAFHGCFDLQYFGYLHTNFYDNPIWTLQRISIVSLFLFCAGFGQAVAMQQQLSWARFWQRWRRVAFSALLVSAASYLMFPNSFIYFGILHGMALMLIVVRCTAGWGNWLWPLGALALALPSLMAPVHAHWAGAAILNDPGLNWLGLISHKPVTEDYAPLFPWLGVMWWGMASGNWWLQRTRRMGNICLRRPGQAGCSGLWHNNRGQRALATLGRHSLPYYLIHQPVMMGVLSLIRH